jgi:hypothetical protein
MTTKQFKAWELASQAEELAGRIVRYLDHDLSNERIQTHLAWQLSGVVDELREAFSRLEEADE